jgi:hypothetical protein
VSEPAAEGGDVVAAALPFPHGHLLLPTAAGNDRNKAKRGILQQRLGAMTKT